MEVARERMPDLGGKTRAGKEREVAKAREEAAVREVGVVKTIGVGAPRHAARRTGHGSRLRRCGVSTCSQSFIVLWRK